MGYFWAGEGWDEKALTDAGLSIKLLPRVFGIPRIWYLGCSVFGIWDGVFGMAYLVFGVIMILG